MSYFIDSGIWSSVFAVPACVVDEHIKMCSPLSLKILLVMLRHPGAVTAQQLSEQLNISPADISDALGYWIGAGIVSDDALSETSAQPAKATPMPSAASVISAPAAKIEPQEHLSAEPEQKIITLSARRKLSQEDVALLVQQDGMLGWLLQEAQVVLGAPLTPVESEILASLCGYYGMRPDVVLMMLEYCISTGHKSMNYLEKTAAFWQERGITSHEQVEQEILRLTHNNENEKKIVKAFGLYNRGLTSREREYVEKWFSLRMDERLICLACERAAENTGKVSFAYADKIILSWKAKGVTTIKAAMEDLNSGAAQRPSAQNKSAQTSSRSSLDMDKLHEMLHSEFRD